MQQQEQEESRILGVRIVKPQRRFHKRLLPGTQGATDQYADQLLLRLKIDNMITFSNIFAEKAFWKVTSNDRYINFQFWKGQSTVQSPKNVVGAVALPTGKFLLFITKLPKNIV